jgi:hypothetical protein
MTLTRATAALFTAITIILGPALAADSLTPRAKLTATNYGSGLWGGPVGSPAQTGDPQTADVALYGDSIANRCVSDIRPAIEAKGYSLYTWTWSGQNTAGISNAVQSAPRLPARTILVAGTNDVFDPFAVRPQISALANYLTEVGTDWRWMDTYVGRPATLADDLRNSGQVNGLIHGIVGEDRIVRWVDALTAARGRGRAMNYYLQDGVHPWIDAGTGHGDGCAFLASVIASTLPASPR